MAQTFDIRFERSAGLVAFFEAPANTLRLKGRGTLVVDAQGISIAMKRGLANHFSDRSRRISVGDLTGIYREGAALRLEFNRAHQQSATLPFWTRDPAAATEIARLLPQQHAVETDHDSTESRPFRFDWRAFALLIMSVAALIIVSVVVFKYLTPGSNLDAASPPSATETSKTETSPTVESQATAETPIDGAAALATSPQVPSVPNPSRSAAQPFPRVVASGEAGNAVGFETESSAVNDVAAPGTGATAGLSIPQDLGIAPAPAVPAQHDARGEIAVFMRELRALRSEYIHLRDKPDPERLRKLEDRWWQVTVRIHNTAGAYSLYAQNLWNLELAISRAWRNHLWLLAQGQDNLARYQLELAESLQRDLGVSF